MLAKGFAGKVVASLVPTFTNTMKLNQLFDYFCVEMNNCDNTHGVVSTQYLFQPNQIQISIAGPLLAFRFTLEGLRLPSVMVA